MPGTPLHADASSHTETLRGGLFWENRNMDVSYDQEEFVNRTSVEEFVREYAERKKIILAVANSNRRSIKYKCSAHRQCKFAIAVDYSKKTHLWVLRFPPESREHAPWPNGAVAAAALHKEVVALHANRVKPLLIAKALSVPRSRVHAILRNHRKRENRNPGGGNRRIGQISEERTFPPPTTAAASQRPPAQATPLVHKHALLPAAPSTGHPAGAQTCTPASSTNRLTTPAV